VLKGIPHVLQLGPQYFVSILLSFAGLTMAAITRNDRYHEFFAIFYLVQTIVMGFTMFPTLG
jgi:hypothetical protein